MENLATKKICKIPFINKKEKTIYYKNKTVYGLNSFITDKNGKNFQLFQQENEKFVADIPLNNPSVGIILNGKFYIFCSIFQVRRQLNYIKEIFSKIDINEKIKENNKNFKEISCPKN